MREDMTALDLIYVLQHLSFAKDSVGLLSIDRPVRDYLIALQR
jgi:hypothetical protein